MTGDDHNVPHEYQAEKEPGKGENGGSPKVRTDDAAVGCSVFGAESPGGSEQSADDLGAPVSGPAPPRSSEAKSRGKRGRVVTELAIKDAVRERDGYRCTECGMSNGEHI